jgi:succinate-semialdehyde dehydrogenase/glutarate-semialdehyde dehydrogenase
VCGVCVARGVQERSAILSKWFDLIIANSEELARLMTEECGKPLNEARGEVAYGTCVWGWTL